MQAAEIIRLHLVDVIRERLLREMAGLRDPGVGDREPELPEGIERRIDSLPNIAILPDIAAIREHRSATHRAQFCFGVTELPCIASHDRYRAAGFNKHASHGEANATGTAGDEGRGFGRKGRGHGGLL
nr:hypothetical protein [Segnochrobactrum spirostomi]